MKGGAREPRRGRERSAWRRLVRPFRGSGRGQSIVEFALVLPVLLLLIMGALDFARAISVLQIVTNAAREGARAGIIPTNTAATVTATVNVYLAGAGQANCNTVVGLTAGNAGVAGDPVTVAVNCPFQTITFNLIPIPGWTGVLNINQSATMRHE